MAEQPNDGQQLPPMPEGAVQDVGAILKGQPRPAAEALRGQIGIARASELIGGVVNPEGDERE